MLVARPNCERKADWMTEGNTERLAVDPSRGVYGISVAAELAGIGVQTLRLYEARGLLQPARTDGGTRRYSADDLDRLHRIGQLVDAGLNLAGIAMVLDLETQNQQLRADRNDPRPHHPVPEPTPSTGQP
jgi:DNA-binding transcriptional MerR regulator